MSTSVPPVNPSRRSFLFRTLSGAGAIALGTVTHVPCAAAMLTSVSGAAGSCFDGGCEYALDPYYPRVPKDKIVELEKVEDGLQAEYRESFVRERPEVFDVVAQKRKEYAREPEYRGEKLTVELVFAKDKNEDLCLVVCKDGLLCPCTSPAVYNISDEKTEVSQMWNKHKGKVYNTMMVGGITYLGYTHGRRVQRSERQQQEEEKKNESVSA